MEKQSVIYARNKDGREGQFSQMAWDHMGKNKNGWKKLTPPKVELTLEQENEYKELMASASEAYKAENWPVALADYKKASEYKTHAFLVGKIKELTEKSNNNE